MIECYRIDKNFHKTQALKDVTLKLEANKIYGLLGRNGAGKSTLLNIISNRLFASSGTVLIDGVAHTGEEAQREIYCMSEKELYPESMKIKEVFYWTSQFYPRFDMDGALQLAKKFSLPLTKKVKQLSTGYKSIFKLIVALSTNASYVLLDEPVLGLDANHREVFYQELLKNYMEHPKTIVISTHLIEEIANLLEEVIMIKDGSLLLQEPVEDLLARGYTISGMQSAVDAYCHGKEVLGSDSLGGLKTAYLMGTVDEQAIGDLTVTKLDLQKLFVKLTNA